MFLHMQEKMLLALIAYFCIFYRTLFLLGRFLAISASPITTGPCKLFIACKLPLRADYDRTRGALASSAAGRLRPAATITAGMPAPAANRYLPPPDWPQARSRLNAT